MCQNSCHRNHSEAASRSGAELRWRRYVTTTLAVIGFVACQLLVLYIVWVDLGAWMVVCVQICAVLAFSAAVVTRWSLRASGLLAMTALIVGLTACSVVGGFFLWLIPGYALGFGAAYAFGARFGSSTRAAGLLCGIFGASVAALAYFPFGYAAASLQVRSLIPFFLEGVAIMGFVAVSLMSRWRYISAVILILAFLLGTSAIAREIGAIASTAWLIWALSGLPLLASAAIALFKWPKE
jgi:hypothetical protein